MIVVTGLMRSGTSPLAQMLHQMGIPMGTMQRFPGLGEHCHFEWEDAPLADRLLYALSTPNYCDVRSLLREYVVSREGQRSSLGFSGAWGVKTPYLLPYLDDLRVVLGQLQLRLVLFITKREPADTLKSMERQIDRFPRVWRREKFRSAEHLQQRLEKCWEREAKMAAEVIPIEQIWHNPRTVAQRIAEILVMDPDLDLATRGIGRN